MQKFFQKSLKLPRQRLAGRQVWVNAIVSAQQPTLMHPVFRLLQKVFRHAKFFAMEKPNIIQEVRDFLRERVTTATVLARTAGVSNSMISQLKNGRQKDCYATSAQAIHKAIVLLRAMGGSFENGKV